MRVLVAALIAFALVSPAGAARKKAEPKADAAKVEAPACIGVPVEPLLERLKASGFEHEIITDRAAVLRISVILIRNADKPFAVPSKMVIVFIGETAKIGIIQGDKLCAVVTGPASEVRAMLRAVHGISIRQEGTGI